VLHANLIRAHLKRVTALSAKVIVNIDLGIAINTAHRYHLLLRIW
jgi:hypothetical protein